MPEFDVNAPTPLPSLDPVVVTRFIAGEASSAEVAAVERWVAADPANAAELAELRRIWSRAAELPGETRVDALWQDLRGRMHDDLLAETPRPRPTLELLPARRSPARRWVVGGLAAAAVAAVMVGVGLRNGVGTSAVATKAVEREYRTARGERAAVQLADGSRVELGVDSRIRVTLHPNGLREVRLDGEAVFDVVHDERRPFFVYAGGAVTEDLGTKFNVRAYPGEAAVLVAVVAGKVALRPAAPRTAADTASVVLGPRDVGELDPAGTRVQRNVDPDRYFAWTRGRLVFRDLPLAEIAKRIGRWYDVDVALADSASGARRLTVELDAPSLDVALAAVAVPLGLRVEQTGRRVVLSR